MGWGAVGATDGMKGVLDIGTGGAGRRALTTRQCVSNKYMGVYACDWVC
jgi:hypothetical protein